MKTVFFLFFLMVSLSAFGQFSDDFSDGNLDTNPSWIGDLNNFIVNAEGEMQLDASSAGESLIYLPTNFPDSIEWQIYFRLEFSPSSSNQLRIDLMTDGTNPVNSSGYFLEIGESGSNDALKLYRSDSGTPVLIGTGTLGALGGSIAEASLRIQYRESGLWSIYSDYENSACHLLDFEVFDETYLPSTMNHFSIQCFYTSTRVDKFFFDDLKMSSFVPDNEGPQIANYEVLDENSIEVYFDEPVDISGLSDLSNFAVGTANPINSSPIGIKGVLLEFSERFPSGSIQQLQISVLEDLFGNISTGLSIDFFLSELPQKGDLLINEILFNPYPNQEDFIEFYNHSNKFLRLKGVFVENSSRENDVIEIRDDIIISPEDFVVLTGDRQSLLEEYSVLSPEKLYEHLLPSFNNDNGNITIFRNLDNERKMIDSFDYDESYHYPLLFDVEGVSLERIQYEMPTNVTENWHSAAEVAGFATPTYVNSQRIEAFSEFEDPFEFTKRVFSPNNDGNNDFLVINYELESAGFVANVKIFDIKGRLVKILSRNLLLGTKGFVKWDGTNADSEMSSIGIYIIVIELIHPSGDINVFKKTCVLADFLN